MGSDAPEQRARQKIDAALIASGWIVQDRDDMNVSAGRGVAVREFKLASGHGFADYLLFVDGRAAGVLEAKAEGFTLTGVEHSLKQDRPRALIQMATGSGKTYFAVTSLYRQIKLAGARRVLFLVDRANLGEQAEKEFENYRTPDDNRKFTELYKVQRLTSNTIGASTKVVITTIQRLYSMLKGEPELDPSLEEGTQFADGAGPKEPLPVVYNPAYPPEYFDVIFIDECHRSIYSIWSQVLEYFDAYLIGLTATPAKHTFGFFNKNLVMEYPHERAVADGVNVQFLVYKIRTKITEKGATIEAGEDTHLRVRTRSGEKWLKPDEDITYKGNPHQGRAAHHHRQGRSAAPHQDRMSNDINGKNGSIGNRSESIGVVQKPLNARLAHVLGGHSMTRLLRDVLWGAFLVTSLSGCPVDWAMEDGFLDRAAAKDIRENSTEMTCPPGEHLALPPKCTAPSATCKKTCIADQ